MLYVVWRSLLSSCTKNLVTVNVLTKRISARFLAMRRLLLIIGLDVCVVQSIMAAPAFATGRGTAGAQPGQDDLEMGHTLIAYSFGSTNIFPVRAPAGAQRFQSGSAPRLAPSWRHLCESC